MDAEATHGRNETVRIPKSCSVYNFKMKIIYIAGPFRASNDWDRENNIRRAEGLALEVWRAGFAALCPHCNTRFFNGAAPDDIWLNGDLAMLKRCDALLTTPDWERSSGAKAEVAFAKTWEIPVFYSLNVLVEHFQSIPTCDHCGVATDMQPHAADCIDAGGN